MNFPGRFNTWEDAARISNEVPQIVDCYWRKIKSEDDKNAVNTDEEVLDPDQFEIEIITSHKPEISENQNEAEEYLVQFVGFVKPEWVKKNDIDAEFMVERYWKRFHKRKDRQIRQKRELCRREQIIKKEVDSGIHSEATTEN